MTIASDIHYSEIIAWANLRHAYRKAARGKRGYAAAAQFEYQLADNLLQLQTELATQTYRFGAYRYFYVHEPKRRKIAAAPFRDRIVHHALCNHLEPLYEALFHPHSYANRVGKGTHRALDQFQHYARRYRYVLRLDIVKHFQSIDHALLRAELARRVQDEQVLWLIDQILASDQTYRTDAPQHYFAGDDLFAALRPRGLPIGNLTSQFWSNVYLNPFDWFVTRELGCSAYLRYVDDFALFSDSKPQLWQWRSAIIQRLARLRLKLHEAQGQVTPTQAGSPWLGFVIYPTHRRLKSRKVVAFRRRFEQRIADYAAGRISFAELDASVRGWVNHARYGDTWGLRRHIFRSHIIRAPRI